MKKRTGFIALLSVFAISGATAAVATGCDGCGNSGIIDAPTNLEAELGAYVIPDYEVVDKNGMVLAGYNVYLKSVKNEDGEELAESYGSAVTVDEAGVYSFVYSAGSKKVKDVTVAIDFADRTAPTINCDDSTIPKFFIKGNSYKVPQYTLSGDFERSKCWAKVFYIADDKKETEVKVDGGRFPVDKDSGSYAIRIHVEDAAGNANDYEYVRNVDGPETLVENKVLYLDEEFGERQVSCYQSAYTGGFVSKDAEGAKVYGDEQGAYKVAFNGETATTYNEGLIVMDVPAIIDINEYEDLYMYVYNDSDNDIIMGSQWWNDTTVAKGKWTKLTWNTRNWGNNVSANNVKQIGLVDISGMTIRFIFDYAQKVIPNGTFYLSAMYATPKVGATLECDENILLGSSKHYINDTVELNAIPVDGKTVDYYKLDGEVLPGNSFVITETTHRIEVVYTDGELSKDNMTWAKPEEFTVEGSDSQWQTFGTSDYFAYTFDIYGAQTGWCYAGMQVGTVNGNCQLLGFEISDEQHSKFAGYGGSWKWGDGVKLTREQYDAIRSATEANPVKAALIRRGSEIRAYLIYNGKTEFIASVDNSTLGINANQYGYGQRNGPVNISHNVAMVGSEKKTLLYFENFAATLNPVNDKVTFDGEKFYLGDTVTLRGVTPPAGQMLAYFEVNGQRIDGSKFVILQAQTTVEAIYTNASTLTLADGIQTAEGQTGTVQVAKDSNVILEFVGNAPVGKMCVGFKVDGNFVKGNVIFVSADAHEIEAVFEDTENQKLNDISAIQADGTGLKFDGLGDDDTNKWAPVSVEYVTDFSYDGPDGTVERNSLLKIKTQQGENSFALTNGEDNLDAYEEIYFYVYTTASGIQAGGWWCGDTVIKPNTWTKVSFKRNLNPMDIVNNGTASVWDGGLKNFAIRIFNAPADATVYVTAVYGVHYADVTVTKDEETEQYFTISAAANGKGYKANETVTLTCTGAPANKAFASFTVNGEDIDGNTYTLTEAGAEFGVRFADISTITVGNGISVKGFTAGDDGKYIVGKGVKVTLEYTGTPEAGKLFDYFTVDGERITGNTFTAQTAHTVGVAFADGAANLTWVTGEEADKTDVTYSWSAYTFEGVALGESTHWAVETVITELKNFKDGLDKWYGFDYLVGTNASIQIRIHTSGIFMVQAMGTNHSDGKDIGTIVIDKDKVIAACKAASEETPVVFTVIRDGDTYTVLFNGELVVKSNFDFKAADNKFGVGATDTGWLPLYEMEDYKFKTGADVVAYRLTAKVEKEAQVGLDKTTYKYGETATLTVVGEPPANKLFAYFTVDGKPIVGNEYVITKDVKFGVVFNGITTITLGENVTVVGGEENADGTVSVGMDSTVKLVANVPAGKYFVGFKLNGKDLDGDTFVAEDAAYSVTAVFAEKEQTGSEKLNDISDTTKVIYATKDGGTVWKPASIEYVTDVKFEGNDAAVSESGLIKIVTAQGENSFAFESSLKENLDNYKEIYFYVYTETSGIQAGGWWCKDTNLVAGKWTKVTFRRTDEGKPGTIDGNGENIVWEHGINKFAYRIFNAPAGVTVYVTEVYGIPYADVSVTVEDEVKDYVSFTGTAKEGSTITLTHSGAPENKEFVYFTINGERHHESTYTLGTENIVIGAFFSDAKATLNLVAGVKTSDGETDYIMGEEVELVIDSAAAPANKVFDHFEVDGKPIDGNKFEISSTTHKVEAIFINDAADMTWLKATTDGTEEAHATEGIFVKKFDNADKWVMTYTITDLSSGDWGHLLGVYIGAKSQILQIAFSGSNYTATVYGQQFDPAIALNNVDLINLIKSASEENPVNVTFVRSENNIAVYVTDKQGVTYVLVNVDISNYLKRDDATNDFGYADRHTHYGNPVIDVKYVTGEGKVGLYLDSLKANISFEKAQAEESVYHLGDTVTLIAEEAETGKKFLQFTVNGTPISGNTFTVTTSELYEVVAEYSDVSQLTLADGVITDDGNTEYARGAKVTLSFDSAKLNGKLVDYYIIDEGTESEQRIFNSEFTTSAATHTVKAVLATVEDMTWYETEYAQPDGTISDWGAYKKLGSSENWVLSYDMTATNADSTINKDIPNMWYTGVLFRNNQIIGYEMGEHAIKNYLGSAGSGAGTTWDKMQPSLAGSLDVLNSASQSTPVTLIFIRQGNKLSAYVISGGKTYLVIKDKTHAAFDTNAGLDFGYGWRTDCGGNPDMENIKWVTDGDKVDSFAEHINANSVNGQTSENQINSIYNAQVHAGTAVLTYVTEIPGTLPANVKETGVLKAEFSAGDSTSLTVKNSLSSGIDNYDEVYFYVYVDADNYVGGMKAGSYWCGDTDLESGKWTKVSIYRDYENKHVSKYNADSSNGGKFYDGDGSGFIFRLMGCTGKAVYVTSLYGVPKDVEPVVDESTTNYSLVSGNNELTAIVNDNFFPDAE